MLCLQADQDKLDELEMDPTDDVDDEEADRTMLTLTTASDMIRVYKNDPFILWNLLRVVRNLVRGDDSEHKVMRFCMCMCVRIYFAVWIHKRNGMMC